MTLDNPIGIAFSSICIDYLMGDLSSTHKIPLDSGAVDWTKLIDLDSKRTLFRIDWSAVQPKAGWLCHQCAGTCTHPAPMGSSYGNGDLSSEAMDQLDEIKKLVASGKLNSDQVILYVFSNNGDWATIDTGSKRGQPIRQDSEGVYSECDPDGNDCNWNEDTHTFMDHYANFIKWLVCYMNSDDSLGRASSGTYASDKFKIWFRDGEPVRRVNADSGWAGHPGHFPLSYYNDSTSAWVNYVQNYADIQKEFYDTIHDNGPEGSIVLALGHSGAFEDDQETDGSRYAEDWGPTTTPGDDGIVDVIEKMYCTTDSEYKFDGLNLHAYQSYKTMGKRIEWWEDALKGDNQYPQPGGSPITITTADVPSEKRKFFVTESAIDPEGVIKTAYDKYKGTENWPHYCNCEDNGSCSSGDCCEHGGHDNSPRAGCCAAGESGDQDDCDFTQDNWSSIFSGTDVPTDGSNSYGLFEAIFSGNTQEKFTDCLMHMLEHERDVSTKPVCGCDHGSSENCTDFLSEDVDTMLCGCSSARLAYYKDMFRNNFVTMAALTLAAGAECYMWQYFVSGKLHPRFAKPSLWEIAQSWTEMEHEMHKFVKWFISLINGMSNLEVNDVTDAASGPRMTQGVGCKMIEFKDTTNSNNNIYAVWFYGSNEADWDEHSTDYLSGGNKKDVTIVVPWQSTGSAVAERINVTDVYTDETAPTWTDTAVQKPGLEYIITADNFLNEEVILIRKHS